MNISKKCLPKGKSVSNKKTLDIQHSNHVDLMKNVNSHVASLESEVKELEAQIEAIQTKKQNGEASEDEISKCIDLVDQRLDTIAKINELKSSYNEVDYYTNTANILFKYYDIIEKGNSPPQSVTASKPSKVAKTNHPQNSILNYFTAAAAKTAPAPENDDVSDSESEDYEKNKGSLLDKYISYIDDNYIPESEKHTDCCECCGSYNMTVMNNDGYIFCNECSTMEYIIIDHEKPSYRDPPKEISYFAYKRINHFRLFFDWIRMNLTYIRISLHLIIS